MIAQQDGASLDGDCHLLTQDEMAPMGDKRIKTPGRGVEKEQQTVVIHLLQQPETA
jgi:hypothetical protein